MLGYIRPAIFDLLFKGGPYLAYGVGGKTKIDGVSEKADTSVMMV